MATATQPAKPATIPKTSKRKVLDDDEPTSPRKRRRKAPAAGAAADCFACQDRYLTCDRRRPYCSQCLEFGKSCSGYKTTLTWGVGVASRGKLRGLSLPIVNAEKVSPCTGKPKTCPRRSPPLARTHRSSQTALKPSTADHRSTLPNLPAQSPISPRTGGFSNDQDASTYYKAMLPPPPRNLEPSRPRKRARCHSLEPIQVSTFPSVNICPPLTANPVVGHQYKNYMVSPTMPGHGSNDPYSAFAPVSYQSDTKPVLEQSPVNYTAIDVQQFSGNNASSWPRGSVDSTYSSETEPMSKDEADDVDPDLIPPFDSVLSAHHNTPTTNFPINHSSVRLFDDDAKAFLVPSLVMDDVGAHTLTMFPQAQMPSLRIGNTSELRFLIDYYDRVIAPVIVAFNGPTNPYQAHILQLATESETLQHAIAALSASNMRMRRAQVPLEPRKRASITTSTYEQSVRQASIAYNMMDGGNPQTSFGEPSKEELYYKGASIKGLNQQLSDPNTRQDDSILATLLILCLYHICDTGVAKFQTQFAGVKKILALRGGASGKNSKASNWLTIMFTWFDAMTASINDREGHLAGDDVDMTAFDNDDWALENLAGCDSKLFKIISKLGRLNLLSQSKQVRPIASPQLIQSERRSSSPTAMAAPIFGSKSMDYYSMSAGPPRPPRYDGKGWTQRHTDETLPHDPIDTRTQFWVEWKTIRCALEDWHLDPATLPTTASYTLSSADSLDLLHISESFRYSALLYTERLAFPHLPSSDPKFSELVDRALMHISTVQTDVFLLWPLFITGTECTSLEGRRMIRQRCLHIQRDSGFFNNVTGLELLEKIWRLDDEDGCAGAGAGAGCQDPRSGATLQTLRGLNDGMSGGARRCSEGEGQGFKWRKAMEKNGEEYIVV